MLQPALAHRRIVSSVLPVIWEARLINGSGYFLADILAAIPYKTPLLSTSPLILAAISFDTARSKTTSPTPGLTRVQRLKKNPYRGCHLGLRQRALAAILARSLA